MQQTQTLQNHDTMLHECDVYALVAYRMRDNNQVMVNDTNILTNNHALTECISDIQTQNWRYAKERKSKNQSDQCMHL